MNMMEINFHKYLTKPQMNLLLGVNCLLCSVYFITGWVSLVLMGLLISSLYVLLLENGDLYLNHLNHLNNLKQLKQLKEEKSNNIREDNYLEKIFLDNYPVGLLICEVENKNMKIAYMNGIACSLLEVENTLDLQSSKLNQFEKLLDKKSKRKYQEPHTTLFQNIIEANSNDSGTSINKYFNGDEMIIVNSCNFVPNRVGSETCKVYKLLSIENLSQERKQMLNSIYKNLRTQFLLTISHELNNPLNGLLHYAARLVSSNTESMTKKNKYLEKLRKFKFGIKFFIKNLTLFSKIILRDVINLRPINLSLGPLIKGVLAKFEPFLNAKKIKYISDTLNSNNCVLFYDYEHLRFFLKNVFMYVCYKIEDNQNFRIESILNKDKKLVKFNFYKQNSNKLIYKYLTSKNKDLDYSFSDIIVEKSVKTEDMLKEIIDTLSSCLKIKITHNENNILFFSFECEYFEIENNIEEADVQEFSPDTVCKNMTNFQMVDRSLIMGRIFKDTVMTTITQQSSNNNDIPILNRIPMRKKNSRCDFEIGIGESPRYCPHFFTTECSRKEIDETGINKLKNLSSQDPIKLTNRKSLQFNLPKIVILSTNAQGSSPERNYKALNKDGLNSGFLANKVRELSESNVDNEDDHIFNESSSNRYVKKELDVSNIKNLHNLCKKSSPKKVKKDSLHAFKDNVSTKNSKNYREHLGKFAFTNTNTLFKKIKNNFPVNLPVKTNNNKSAFMLDKRRRKSDLISCRHEFIEDILLTPIYFNRNCRSIYMKPTSILRKHSSRKIVLPRPIIKLRSMEEDSIKILQTSKKDTKLLKTPKTPIRRSNSNSCNCKEVLLVDDESFNINSMKHILKFHKIFPDFCFNGQEALQKVLSNLDKDCCKVNYKIIFMDIMMPVLDGIEASIQIQKVCETNNIDMNIIIISAHDSDVVYQRVKKINIVKEFAAKPIRKSKIEELLKKYYFI